MIRFDEVAKRHGSQLLFVDAAFAIHRGEKVGLVGPNGAGKSSMFRLIVRSEECDAGQVSIERGTSVGYFSQDACEMAGESVIAATMAGAGAVAEAAAQLKHYEQQLADPAYADQLERVLERFGEAQSRFEELGGYALEARGREILAGLGFSQAQMDGDVGALSGGWKMRVALARILLMKPDAMLLDEPTNHLDLESILWLEDFVKNYDGAVFMTSHDRDFMNRIVSKIVEIDGGEVTIFSGDYDFYEREKEIRRVQAESEFERQQAMLAKEEAFIARFKARASHAAQVQSRVKKLEKIERVEPPRTRRKIRFEFPEAPRSGEDVLQLHGVSKRYGDKTVYQGLDFLIRRKERWCVLGVNGAGKSTLLKLAAGHAQADEGKVSLGASVKLGYFAQHAMELLKPEQSVWQSLIAAHPKASIGSLRTLAGAFGFSGADVEKPCRVLSGGEKARLVLAIMLYDPPNFLVLDEPSNHLDMDTKEMLIEALSAYDGTLLLVSHDRQFLRALSNRVLLIDAAEQDSYRQVQTFGGGYEEWVKHTGLNAPVAR